MLGLFLLSVGISLECISLFKCVCVCVLYLDNLISSVSPPEQQNDQFVFLENASVLHSSTCKYTNDLKV